MKTRICALTAAVLMLGACGCQEERRLNREVLYQVSNISALMKGCYDGDMTIEQLQLHGDLGLGTFNGLDGEMVVLDGVFYQITADGVAHPITEEMLEMRTPFATMTFFEPDQSVAVHGLVNYSQLRRHVDNFLINPNAFYAIRIDGLFRYVKFRSVARQTRPYLPASMIAAHQRTHEFRNVRGTMVGFRLGGYVAGVNVPG